MKIAVLNWTAEANHFGCKLVCEAIESELDRVGIELSEKILSGEHWESWRPTLDKVDLVLVNGEGSLHHDRHLQLLEVGGHYPSVLFNTVFDSITDPRALSGFIAAYTRESLSLSHIHEHLGERSRTKTGVIPDAILVSSTLCGAAASKPSKGAGIGVTDSVRYATGIRPSMAPEKYLSSIGSYEGVCTGRFHGILCCAALGIPFSAYGTNCHKNRGAMQDMGLAAFYDRESQKALELVPKTAHEQASAYVDDGRKRIRRFFDGLHEVI